MLTDIKSLLALITICFFFAVVLVLFFVQIPLANLDLIKTFGIALITSAGVVIGYYFGSSEGSARKTELLSPALTPVIEETVIPPIPADAGYIDLPLLLYLVAFVGAIAITGCVGQDNYAPLQPADNLPVQSAGKALLAVKSSIVTAATLTAGLCKTDTLNTESCTKAKNAYNSAKPAYDAAVDAYLLMSSGDPLGSTGGDAANFGAALLRVQNLATDLLLISGGAK